MNAPFAAQPAAPSSAGPAGAQPATHLVAHTGAPAPAPGRPSVLVDLRPCYEGFAGIPQETRLIFAMFADMGLGRLGGLASGIHFAAPPRRGKRANTPFDRTLEQARIVISQDTKRHHALPGLSFLLPGPLRRRMHHVTTILSMAQREERLDLRIDPALFEDFLWMKLFDNTLPPADRHLIGRAEYFPTALGHENARSLSLLPMAFQRKLDTTGWDVFFAATVSPYKPRPGTSFMIRYYDALPLLSPHTIGEPWPHTNSHARMLLRNMQQGANFYCDSEPVRADVLALFPGAERRVHTIPALVAPEYRPDVRPEAELRTILKRRASTATAPAGGRRELPTDPLPKLIIACSTLEPRKNYLRLFRGFELARRMTKTPMQLLIVANPGWRSDAELAELKLLVREGAYHVSGVPLPELRVLYSMAHLVVAPSRAEGFDYSGVEGMACGTPLVASGIPVHRWVYGDAAEYFDPYDDAQLGEILARLVDLPRESGHLSDMRDRGLRQAALYQNKALAPRWEQAVLDVIRARTDAAGAAP